MYQVKFTNQAEKDLKRIDRVYLAKISEVVESLSKNPLLGQKMSGQFNGYYRIKIPPLRIIYTPDFKSKIIWVCAIGQRQGIYN